MVWSRSDHVEQKLQPAGLIEPVVVVEVELYSPAVQWVQINGEGGGGGTV